jgi:hypothetical protein
MRTLQPFEVTLKLEVIENPAVSPITLLTQSPGDPATSFILVPGTGYELRYEYEYIVPHGVDPPFDGAYSLTVSSPPAVPMFSEGMFVLLLGLSGTGWWMLRAMRRRGDFHG